MTAVKIIPTMNVTKAIRNIWVKGNAFFFIISKSS